METFVYKTYNSLIRGRCALSSTYLWKSRNFIRYEHSAVKLKSDQEQLTYKVSTLYVPGRYSGKMYQILKPLVDVSFIEKNLAAFKLSCQLRGIELDLDNLIPLLKDWKNLKDAFTDLTSKDHDNLEDENRLSTAERESLTEKRDYSHLKEVKNNLYEIEDTVMPLVQCIPNFVSDYTPTGIDVVEDSIGIPRDFAAASHVEIGKNTGMLEFSNVSPSAYYMKGKFAELEMCAQEYFYDKFQDLGFSPMSCTDFCKSFIVEAIGLDPYSYDDCLPLKPKDSRDIGQKLNLVGGASFASFCAYLSNMNVNKKTFPAKYFSLGRCYSSKNRRAASDLFSVVQSSNIQLLVLSEEDEDSQFNVLVETLVSIYRAFNIPFRTVNVGAKKLNVTESRRKQIELWSPSRLEYIPVAHISSRGNFISKRLHICFGEEHKIHGHCSIVEGIAVNIPVFIGCVVENFQNKNGSFDFPDILNGM